MNSSVANLEGLVPSQEDPHPLVSVVMPAYNEAENIAAAFAEVVQHIFSVVPAAELVFVDDGSRDDTFQIASNYALQDSRIRVFHQQNAGHGPAVLHGIRETRGEYCLLLDSDRQIGLQGFAETWRLIQTHDAVLGVRRQRADPRHRLVLSAALRWGISHVLRSPAADSNAPYKLIRKELALQAIKLMPEQALIPSILLSMYVRQRHLNVIDQPVPHFARSAGVTTLNLKRLTVFCSKALIELLRFHRTLYRLGE